MFIRISLIVFLQFFFYRPKEQLAVKQVFAAGIQSLTCCSVREEILPTVWMLRACTNWSRPCVLYREERHSCSTMQIKY